MPPGLRRRAGCGRVPGGGVTGLGLPLCRGHLATVPPPPLGLRTPSDPSQLPLCPRAFVSPPRADAGSQARSATGRARGATFVSPPGSS